MLRGMSTGLSVDCFLHLFPQELACMAVFMQGSASQRQYPSHYMDSAVSTYFSYCKLVLITFYLAL